MNVFDLFFPNLKYKNVALAGMDEELFSIYVKKILDNKKNILIVTSTLLEANQLFHSISNYTNQVYLFPMDDFLTSEAIAVSPDLMVSRLETLKEVVSNEYQIVITNLMGYLRFLPSKKIYNQHKITLSLEDDVPFQKLVEKLIKIGYKRESIVTKTGEIGVRGFILDIFPLGYDHPIRIEFFGDTIDSIRTFNEKTQRSISKISSVEIFPFCEQLAVDDIPEEEKSSKFLNNYTDPVNISKYLDDLVTIYKDNSNLKVAYEQLQNEILEYRSAKDVNFHGEYMFSLESIYQHDALLYMTLNNLEMTDISIIDFGSKQVPSFHDQQEAIEKYISNQISLG